MAGKIVKASAGLGMDGKPHPHPKTEDLVNTIGFSLVQELLQYLKGPEGEEVLESILEQQSRVVAKLATTEEARKATRVAAAEAIAGTYDVALRKWTEFFKSGRYGMQYVAIGVTVYVMLLAVGILLSLWRLAFFGLH